MAKLWTAKEVCEWLEEIGLKNWQQAFIDNEIDGPTLLKMTERMTERIFDRVKEQVQFLSALGALNAENSAAIPETFSETCVVTPVAENYKVRFPPALLNALNSKDPALRSHQKNRLKNSLIQALFDHLSAQTLYPAHIQYVELLKWVILCFPFLREKYGSGFDALHESLKNKFKKERKPLVDVEEVVNMKKKFSSPNTGRRRSTEDENHTLLVKKNKADAVVDAGEDDRSVSQHVDIMKQEAQKLRPNFELIRKKLKNTRKYRGNFICTHSTAETLAEFPCLRRPVLLLEEASALLEVDIDKQIIANLSKMSSQLVEKAAMTPLKKLCLQSLEDCTTDEERHGQMVNAAIILLPSLFKENPSKLFVLDQEPVCPTPTIVLTECAGGKPLNSNEVNVKMDGHNMFIDGGDVDVSLALGLVFSLYHVYQVQYPGNLKKTMSFLEAFVFKLKTAKLGTTVPVAVQRLYNSLNVSE